MIIGAGNIGFKIGLLMVERGAKVYICAKNLETLKKKVDVINLIKPLHTAEKVSEISINQIKQVISKLDIIIGATNGKPVIKKEILKEIKKSAILIDLGKGTFFFDAVKFANLKKINIYRVDISVALEGKINKFLMLKDTKPNFFGKKKLLGKTIVSSGILGSYGDLIVDDLHNPTNIFGMSDGAGDFIRILNKVQKNLIKKIKIHIKKNET